MRRQPKMIARIMAKRGECLFVDRVNHREVWVWRYAGEEWMGQSRFGMWVERE